MVGPVYKGGSHSYGKDFSRPTPEKQSAGPVMNVAHQHQFKHQLERPHMRDAAKKAAPVYEVTESHHYRESKTHKADLGGLVGPIYSQTPAKHTFSDGYVAPKARSESKEREEKQKALVSKFFNKEQRKETTKAAKAKFESLASESKSEVRMSATSMQQSTSVTSSSQQVSKTETKVTKISAEEAKVKGEERKQEALKRREEFVVKQSEARVATNIKSTQELHREREEIIQSQVRKMQEENKQMMERYLQESKQRADILQKEQEMIEKENNAKAELMRIRMEEQAEKEKQRKASLKRQDSLLREEGVKKEQEERRKSEERKRDQVTL